MWSTTSFDGSQVGSALSAGGGVLYAPSQASLSACCTSHCLNALRATWWRFALCARSANLHELTRSARGEVVSWRGESFDGTAYGPRLVDQTSARMPAARFPPTGRGLKDLSMT